MFELLGVEEKINIDKKIMISDDCRHLSRMKLKGYFTKKNGMKWWQRHKTARSH